MRSTVAEIERLRVQRLPPAEGEEPLRQVGALLRRRHDQLGDLLHRRVVDLVAEDLRVPQDHGEQVVEIVRDAAGQMAERFHLLRLLQLRFQLHALRLVGEDADDNAMSCRHRRRLGEIVRPFQKLDPSLR